MDRSQINSDRDGGIFAKLSVKFNPKGTVTHLQVQNQIMLICLNGQRLQFIKLQTNEENDVSFSLAPHDRIAHLHLDPTGNHALISSSGGENYYLSIKSKSARSLKRLKNHVVTAVGWNMELSKDHDTSFIALGTSKGLMMETSINHGSINYLKTLSNSLDKEKPLAITSIHLSQCFEYGTDGSDSRWMLLVCMSARLYCLSGVINPITRESTAQQVVGTMLSAAMLDQTVATLQPLFKEKPRSFTVATEQNSALSLCAVYPDARNETPNKYVWLNSLGVVLGSLDPSRTDASASDGYDMLEEAVTIPHKMIDGKLDLPIDVALTEHHVLLLYSDRFVAISLLNQKVMHEELLTNESYHIVGMTRDSASQFIWIYTESSILKYRPVDETKSVHLENLRGSREYTKAMKLTYTMTDQKPHQLVLKKLAEQQIAEKKFEAAAETLSGSTEPFESTFLKFLSAGTESRNGLKRFLELKLKEMVIANQEDKMRRDALVILLMELFLSEMAKTKRIGADIPLGTESPEKAAEQETNVRQLRDQLFVFMKNRAVREAVEANRKAIYQLMSTHADYESKLELARTLKDRATEVDIYIHTQNYSEALKVISEQGDPAFFYQYSPLLFPHIPRALFKAWIHNDRIAPSLLLPSLYKCHGSKEMREAAIHYLKLSVERKLTKGVDKQTHNFYITLLAQYKPNSLLPYFETYGFVRKDVPYDVEFALRLCLEKDREKEEDLSRCCVFLYCVAGMFEQAVDRALPVDLNLAKDCLKKMDQCHDDANTLMVLPLGEIGSRPQKYSTEMKRRIWLKIARYVITEQKDVAACMNLLKESNDILKIQDLLPHFPEFTKIEHFKEPLCSSLKDHSVNIQRLQKEMKETAEVANDIRTDMDKLKTMFTIIKPADKCEKCKERALTRPFFAFSCKHFYHRDCLEEAIQPTFTREEMKNFQTLKSRLEKCKRPQRLADQTSDWAILSKKLDRLMSESCILCGPKMIKSVVRPLLTEEEYDKEMETW